MRAATSLPPHKSLHLLLAFAAAGLTTLTSCGEKQTATIGGENTDAASTSLDSDTSASSDSLGKRLGVAMPSTAVNFTQIPAQDPNVSKLVAIRGSRDGTKLVARTEDSILILGGSNLSTTTQIPADSLSQWVLGYHLQAGLNFIFELQGVRADADFNLNWVMDTYRMTPNHANYGKRETTRVPLNLPSGDEIVDVKVRNDQLVILTSNSAGPVRIRTFDETGTSQGAIEVTATIQGTAIEKIAVISGAVDGNSVVQYWLYGIDLNSTNSTIYRLSTDGALLGTYKLPGASVTGLTSSTSAPLRIFARVVKFDDNGTLGEDSVTYAFPFQPPGATTENVSPINDSTRLNTTVGRDYDELIVLGGDIFRVKDEWTSVAGSMFRLKKIVNETTNQEIRSLRFPNNQCRTNIIPISASTDTDLILGECKQLYNAYNGSSYATPLIKRTTGTNTVEIMDNPFSEGEFAGGLVLAVIPGAPGQTGIKVLVYSRGASALGILTLPATGGAASFSGPYPVAGLDDATIVSEIAVSRIGNQVVAYLTADHKIRTIDLTSVLANPALASLTAGTIVDASNVPGASRFQGLMVKDNFLYGFLLQEYLQPLQGRLMTKNLAQPATPPVYTTMEQAVVNNLPGAADPNEDDKWRLNIQVSTETDPRGRTVPYVYSTLVDGSIMELKMNPANSSLASLTYWLRPQDGAMKFGPAPFKWTRAGDSFIGSPYPGQLIIATTSQLKKSYVQSQTLLSELPSLRNGMPPILRRGASLGRQDSFTKKIGVNPRVLPSGTRVVSCPGFEAYVNQNGNFIVEQIETNNKRARIWSAITVKGGPVPGSFLDFGANGRIALLDPAGRVKWNAVTAGMGAMSLNMQRDGNLVAYDTRQKPAKAVWDSMGCFLGKCNATTSLVPNVCK